MKEKKKMGLIVNPIAGMGGKVGLKGTDGPATLERAKALGAVPEAPRRTVQALEKLKQLEDHLEIVTPPGEMGEDVAREGGFTPRVINVTGEDNRVNKAEETGHTTAGDTARAALKMLDLGVDLLCFAGGDGTARDVYGALGDALPVLGIPCGVKIHSGVFATSPQSAGELAADYLKKGSEEVPLTLAEVMDVDEEAFRENRVSSRLFGYLKVPYQRKLIQSPKAGSVLEEEEEAMREIAGEVIENMEEDRVYLIGPGTTTAAVVKELGMEGTLLGVDAVCNGELLGRDLSEEQLLKLIEERRSGIVVTVIGGQGYVFGRGNQQISARVIRKVGRENVTIIATRGKLLSLEGKPLLVDTGDPAVDKLLTGYFQVVTGFSQRKVVKVTS